MIRPYILVNFAISGDGKIGASQKGPSRFTSKLDLDRLHAIRLRADGILVGRGTLEADNMSMTIPAAHQPSAQPLRCVISRNGQFDSQHRVFHSEGGDIHLIATEAKSPPQYPSHATFHCCSLEAFLEKAKRELGVETLLCEGGGSLVKALFKLDVIDEINLTIAGHTLIGGKEAPTLTGAPQEFLSQSRHYELVHFEPNDEQELFATWKKRTDSKPV